MHNALGILDRIRWSPFYNDSGKVIPPWSPCAVTGVKVENGVTLVTVTQADTDQLYPDFIVTGDVATPKDSNGVFQDEHTVFVAYDFDDDDPSNGDRLGVKPGTFTAFDGYLDCFLVRDYVDSDRKILLATIRPIDRGIGKADNSISTTSTGTVSIYKGKMNDLSDSSIDITCTNISVPISAGDWVLWEYLNGDPACIKLCR